MGKKTTRELLGPFTSDYFDVIAHREYDFIKGEWGEELKTPKPEFNQPVQ